jgi:hypothetical protein
VNLLSIITVHKKSQQQQHPTMKKKLNQDQHPTQKREHFKRKYPPMKKISNKVVAHQFLPSSTKMMTQLIEDKTLSMSAPSRLMKKKCYLLHIDSNTDPTLFLSDYSTISNKIFKEMLFTKVISDIDKNFFNKLLDIEETSIFIRQLTQLFNKLNYFKLQDEQWSYYYHLGIQEGIWTGRVSKNMAIINSMCHTYGRSKLLVEQRRRKYQQEHEQIENEINQHMKQIPA